MSSRNNNFSNRAQKAMLQVATTPSLTPEAPANVQVTTVESGSSARASVKVSWVKPGNSNANVGTDGKEYWGMDQESSAKALDYQVEYSLDGGEENTWVKAEGCSFD